METIATGEYVEYTSDHRNRLTAVTYKTSTGTVTKKVEYDYDVFDRRIAKRVDDSADGSFDRTYRYVYDGEDIVLVFDGTGSLENRYLHGPGIDEVFADENALGEILWALTDNQGTVRDWAERDVATGTTSVVNHVTYDGFGEITACGGPGRRRRTPARGHCSPSAWSGCRPFCAPIVLVSCVCEPSNRRRGPRFTTRSLSTARPCST